MKLQLVLAMLVTACAPAHAGEFNEKPVMCGTLDEAMGAIGVQDQRKMFEGIQITSVLDPDDEVDGVRDMPAMLPVAFYMNLEKKTYTIIEYHPSYSQYCIISFGMNLEPVSE